jgi:hypothetical protein
MHEHEGSTRKVLGTTLNSPLDQDVLLCPGVSHPGHSEVRTPAHASRPGFKLRNGFEGLTSQYGARIKQVQLDDIALARYSARRQEGTTIRLHSARELMREDLKQGRAGSFMPFDLACEFFETGDMALLDLWLEFERESFGRSVVRCTKGLRARLLPKEAEKTDEELAAQEVGGADLVGFSGWFYRKLARVPGLEGKVLTALDTGGFAALVELLRVYHLDSLGGYYQIENMSETESES